MIICDMSLIIICKIPYLCFIRHFYFNTRYTCNFSIHPINNHLLENTTASFNSNTFFWCRSRQMNICRKITCCLNCTHTVLPFIKLVTSTNKSVLHDIPNILEIRRNGKQYFNSVHVCLNFLQL